MAVSSLLCSVALLTALVVSPDKYAVLVEATNWGENFRNVDASMLRTGHTGARQQAIAPLPLTTTTTTTQAPPPEVSDAPRLVIELLEEQKQGSPEINAAKAELLEEEREWTEHAAAVSTRRPRRPKSNRRRPPMVVLDPRKTWEAFLRHTEQQQGDEKRKERARKVNHAKLRSRDRNAMRANGEIQLAMLNDNNNQQNVGISRQEMIEHMRDLIRDASVGISRIEDKCGANSTKPECLERRNPAGSPLLEIERSALIPETYSGFTWRLAHKMKIRKQREVELKEFHRPLISGTMERGEGLQADEGRFTAPISGLYVFHANIHFNASGGSSQSNFAPDGLVILKLCIDSNCINNFGLSAVRGIGGTESVFTLNLAGPLHLSAGRTVSLFVANKSRSSAIRILEDSTFSGYLTSNY